MGKNQGFPFYGSSQPVIFLIAPTATGKSELAMEVAIRFNAEIVNCDSQQVYKFMDIGSAKPSKREREAVRHHLIDVVPPDEDFNAGKFASMAREAVKDIVDRGKKVIVVCGCGLYMKALLEGLSPCPQGKPALRTELNDIWKNDPHSIYEKLTKIDPVSASRIHKNDKQRIIRALEIYYTAGLPASELFLVPSEDPFPFPYVKFGLLMERSLLYKRIEERVDRMMEMGFLEEVKGLVQKGLNPSYNSMRAIGYRHLYLRLMGELDLDEAVRLIKRDTKRYAKRQLTWFRRDPEIKWFLYPDEKDEVIKNIDALWH